MAAGENTIWKLSTILNFEKQNVLDEIKLADVGLAPTEKGAAKFANQAHAIYLEPKWLRWVLGTRIRRNCQVPKLKFRQSETQISKSRIQKKSEIDEISVLIELTFGHLRYCFAEIDEIFVFS